MKHLTVKSARARWLLGVALCALVAIAAAVENASGNLVVATASTQAAVSVPTTSMVQHATSSQQLQSLTARTLLLGELMSTPPILTQIAHRAGVQPSSLSAATSYLQNIPEPMLGPDLEVRGMQIIKMRALYQLDIEPDPNLPRLQIYARAPTVAGAEQLANAAVPGLLDYLHASAVAHNMDRNRQVSVEQLGSARGAVVSSHVNYELGVLTFLIAFGLCAAVILCAGRIRAGWKLAACNRRFVAAARPGAQDDEPERLRLSDGLRGTDPSIRYSRAPDGLSRALVATPGRGLIGDRGHEQGPRRSRDRRRIDGRLTDNWPHTTRLLPWMIAAFMLVLWLVPFDSIQLGGSSLPIDLKFDRILLPVIVVVWILALAAAGRAAPRLRLSWIHAGVLGFVALACLTFVVNGHYLDQTLQLNRGIKQLLLLGAYAIFFLVVASVVRRSEIPAFLRYTLVLAVIAGLGTIIEYRLQYNIFYDFAHKLLPGFQVGAAQSSSVDNLGRRLVEGPAGVPLEAVGMFTLALPIALVGITDAKRWRPRILYGLAAAILLAAAVSTERKSGLLGPLGVVLTTAYFRRRQIVRLIPLALVLVAIVKFAAPGAIGGVTGQLAPSNLGVDTVSERVVRWDAIRPDVWLHFAVGQGFGVYSVRVLDNEFLDRLIEGGVLGLAAYVLMLSSIVFIAVGAVRKREPVSSTAGIVAAAAAIGTLVLSGTYDSMGFPHVPYIFFSLAALLAVSLESPVPIARSRARLRRTGANQLVLTELRPDMEEAWRL